MRKTVLVLLFVAGLLPLTATKGQKRPSPTPPCGKYDTQAEAGECAYKEYQAADAELNKAYNQLAAQLDADGRTHLKEAELAWISYRDKNCEYESSFYLGGTMRPMIESFCLARMTKARSAELREQLRFQREQ
ncbi:MAG: lysozyme inhibitor LprI family protein [Pyrinomonadaceae bacterium]